MKSTVIMIIVAVVIFGIAVSILVLSLVTKPKEFGLMSGCFDPSGIFRVSRLSNTETFDVCEVDHELKWDKELFPLKVYATTDNDYLESTYKQTVGYATNWMNTSFGFQLFEITDDIDSDIYIKVGVPHGSWGVGAIDANGACYHNQVVDGMKVTIFTSNVVTPSELSAVLVHELGHAIGLGHNDVEESFMHIPTLTLDKIRVRDSNKELIQTLYKANTE